MKIKIGDRVKFLNEVGEGRVTSFLNDKTAEVEVEDGFRVPVPVSELIPKTVGNEDFIEPADRDDDPLKPAKPPEEIPVANGPTERDRLSGIDLKRPVNLMMALAKEPTEPDRYDLYLINDSPLKLYFILSRDDGSKQVLIKEGRMAADTKIKIREYQNRQLISGMELTVNAIYFHDERPFPGQSPVNITWKLEEPATLFREIKGENDYFNRPAIFNTPSAEKPVKMKRISLEELGNQKKESKNDTDSITRKGKPEEGTEEVDLHLETLTDNPVTLTDGEKLELQLARFQTSLEGGIRGKNRRMVFIHGLGSGKLKHEIRKILEREYPNLKYQDASFKEYGYGATMVIFTGKK